MTAAEGLLGLSLVTIIVVGGLIVKSLLDDRREIEAEAGRLRMENYALRGSHRRGVEWVDTQVKRTGMMPTLDSYMEALMLMHQEMGGILAKDPYEKS